MISGFNMNANICVDVTLLPSVVCFRYISQNKGLFATN
jgi:hypothetical protein